jgi:hypothetical protein
MGGVTVTTGEFKESHDEEPNIGSVSMLLIKRECYNGRRDFDHPFTSHKPRAFDMISIEFFSEEPRRMLADTLQCKGVVQTMDEIKLLRLLANGPKYLAEIEHIESCSQMSALSAAIRLRKQRLIEFSYLKNSPLHLTAGGERFLRRVA